MPLELIGTADAILLAMALGWSGRDDRSAALHAERFIHGFLSDECTHGEWHAGPKTEALIGAVRKRGMNTRVQVLCRIVDILRPHKNIELGAWVENQPLMLKQLRA